MNLKKHLKLYINISIITNIIFFIGACFLIVDKTLDLQLMCNLIGIACFTFSLGTVVAMYKTPYFNSFIPSTIQAGIFGIIFIFVPTADDILLPIFAATWMIEYGNFHMQIATDFRKGGFKIWKIILVLALICINLGLLILIDKNSLYLTKTSRLGIYILLFSIFQIINLHLIKRNLKTLTDYLLKRLNGD